MPALMTDPHWTTTSRFVVRIGGLPVEALAGIEPPAARDWAHRVLLAEQALERIARSLDDTLHSAIGGNTDDGARHGLINIRRRIFQGKLPGDPAAFSALAARLPDPTAVALTEWARERLALEELRAQGGPEMTNELRSMMAGLAELADDPVLRRGILLAAPELDLAIDSYLRGSGTGSGAVGKRQRHAAQSFLHYIYRTAAKTSPFSTFTSVALASFDGSQGGVASGGAGRELTDCMVTLDARSFPRLNVAILGRLTEAIKASAPCRADLPVQLVSGLDDRKSRLRFVRKAVKPGDDVSTVAFDTVTENLFYLQHAEYLDYVVGLFAGAPQLRYDTLVSELGKASGAALPESDAFARALLHLGLIESRALAIDTHADDPVIALACSLQSLAVPWATDLARQLAQVSVELRGYADADLAGRRAILSALRLKLIAMLSGLGAKHDTVPQALVYEDVRGSSAVVPFDPAPWLACAQALRAVMGMSYAFDAVFGQRMLLKGYFLARYGPGGRCDDVLRFTQDFQEEIYTDYLNFLAGAAGQQFGPDGSWVPQENWLGRPEVGWVDAARAEFARRIRALGEAAGDAEEIVLDDDFVEAVSRPLAPISERFRAQSHFIQVAGSADGPIAVLNRSWGGVAVPFSRFTHCFEAGFGDQWRAELTARQPAGVALAELTGGFDTTNLNLHHRMTEYEIVCPAEVSSAPEAAQLPLADLYLCHDAGLDQLVLRSRRLGKDVLPVYLGFLMPMALPEIPRVLLLLSPSSLISYDVWGGFADPSPEQPVLVRPRVRYRNVVLSRRRWLTRVTDLPARPRGWSNAELAAHYLDWQRWRARHGLPERAFATVGMAPRDGEPDAGMAMPGKPHYVRFGSLAAILALEDLFDNAQSVVTFTEMLPDAGDLHVVSDSGHHVAELVIETIAFSQPAEAQPHAADPEVAVPNAAGSERP